MTTGRVQILARDKVRGGRVDVNGLDIIAADTRAEKERPHGYGVYVLHGAFTLWNMQFDDSVLVSANLVGPRISLDTPAPTVQTLLPNHPNRATVCPEGLNRHPPAFESREPS